MFLASSRETGVDWLSELLQVIVSRMQENHMEMDMKRVTL